MGIKERHERDRQAVRRAILDAARELFVIEGFRNVSIRKIAERIEYSPAAIYGYFTSKDDIFFELAEEGFRLLGDPDRVAAEQSELARMAPLDRLRAIFWHLYQFSRQHPQYFALMFVDRSVPRITREYERFGFVREMKQHLVEHIQSCVDAGVLPPTVKPMVAMRLLSVGIVGVATMHLSERLGPTENPDQLARDVINVVLAGLETGVTLESTADLECRVEDESPTNWRAS
jgi:AcrR family transcriptional regulator